MPMPIMSNLDKIQMIVTDISWRASRHKRATSEHKYLIMDLEYIDQEIDELRGHLAKLIQEHELV
jgi:uncharacterized protein with HEPN domain